MTGHLFPPILRERKCCGGDTLCPVHVLVARQALRDGQHEITRGLVVPRRRPPSPRVAELKARRLKLGRSIAEVAETMQPRRGRSTVTQWESGQCRPTDEHLDAYAAALDRLGPRLPAGSDTQD